jgi:hypothetical protein
MFLDNCIMYDLFSVFLIGVLRVSYYLGILPFNEITLKYIRIISIVVFIVLIIGGIIISIISQLLINKAHSR